MPNRPAWSGFRLTLFCAALFAPLSGCTGVPGLDTVTGIFSSDKASDTATSGGIDMPVFEVGDEYTFDNPVERWEVMEIRDDRIYWRDEKGERKVTGFNPLLPPYAWQSRLRGSGRRFIRDKEGALFPMKVGASLSFRTTVTTDRPPFGWEYHWHCTVDGQKTLKSGGETFQTFVVRCARDEAATVTYFYSPMLRNVLVSRTETGDGKPDVRNLLAFERADGTVVAGIDPDDAGHTEIAAPPAVAPGPAPMQKEMGTPKRATRPVNPPADRAVEITARDVAASLVLAQPVFGGRPTPPPPLPPEPEPMAEAPSGDRPPSATPAPVPTVQKAKPPRPAAARPVSRASPRRPTESVPVSEPGLLGPRAATASGFGAARARIPVPPPPATRRVPPPPQPVAVSSGVPPAPMRAAVRPPPANAVPAVPSSVSVAAAPAVPPPPVAVAPPVPPAPSVKNDHYMVHLASYRTIGDAEMGWQALLSAHTELLQSLTPKVRPVIVKGKGTFYRLYAGPLDEDAANDLCRKLKDAGAFCIPTS